MSWFDGTLWYGDVKVSSQAGGIDPLTDAGPGAVVFRSKLYLFYKGRGTTQLYMSWYDATRWYGDTPIANQPGGIDPWSDATPTAAVFDDRLFLVYKGARSDVIYLSWFDGATWSGDVKISDQPGGIDPRTNDGPDLLVHNNRLTLIYTGRGSYALYVSWCDGTTWSGDVPVNSQPGRIDPLSGAGIGLSLMPHPLTATARAGTPMTGMVTKPTPRVAVQPAEKTGIASAGGGVRAAGGMVTKPMLRPASRPAGIVPDEPGAGTVSIGVAIAQPAAPSPLIGDINLLGTHDSAAINTFMPTVYACHRMTITQQLGIGVRLLDVRLKVITKGGGFVFMTCHGDIGSTIGINEYQSLDSLLQECWRFLLDNPSQFIALSLKVDDWANTTNRAAAFTALKLFLADYPILVDQPDMPTVSQARGKLYLINRMNTDPALGVPIAVPDNTDGALLPAVPGRNFPVYVQDRYSGLPVSTEGVEKLKLFTAAIPNKPAGGLLLNFGSGTRLAIGGVYIHGDYIASTGKQSAASRPRVLGWSLFDYLDMAYATDLYGELTVGNLILDAAAGYPTYNQPFKMRGNGRDGL